MVSKKSILKKLQELIKSEKGQMLLVVLVVLILLFIIVFAVISNVTIDVKETQIEREYEKGYALAENELLKIAKDGFDNWDRAATKISGGLTVDNVDISKFCESGYTCYYSCWVGDSGNDECVIIKRRSSGSGGTGGSIGMIYKDETVEADVSGESGSINLSWDGASAMSIMLVCQTAGSYVPVRAIVCRTGGGDCSGFLDAGSTASSIIEAQAGGPLDMGSCGAGSPLILRLRAMGADAVNVDFGGTVAAGTFEEMHVQGFPEGFGVASDLPAPELYYITQSSGAKQLPAIFDYVLFVGGDNETWDGVERNRDLSYVGTWE